jgi:hypothetical protein
MLARTEPSPSWLVFSLKYVRPERIDIVFLQETMKPDTSVQFPCCLLPATRLAWECLWGSGTAYSKWDQLRSVGFSLAWLRRAYNKLVIQTYSAIDIFVLNLVYTKTYIICCLYFLLQKIVLLISRPQL